MTTEARQYYSQFEQDKFVENVFFPHKDNGVFVDIGAYDGVYLSNSLYFEKYRNWTGLCIEPIPSVFEKLKATRKCVCIQGCVSAQVGTASFLEVAGGLEVLSGLVGKCDDEHLQRIDTEISKSGGEKKIIQVECFLLSDLLDKHGIKHVDYCSIDTEGAEFEILKSIDFSKVSIDVLTIEFNAAEREIREFMHSKGYRYIETLGCDHVYKKIG